MKGVLVRYRVKPDRSSENERLVRAVYEELAEKQPDGFRYITFRADDGVSFFHLALVADGASSPLPEVTAFQAFTEKIRERCDEPPASVEVSRIGSYGLFD
jgi:hypothetical protein